MAVDPRQGSPPEGDIDGTMIGAAKRGMLVPRLGGSNTRLPTGAALCERTPASVVGGAAAESERKLRSDGFGSAIDSWIIADNRTVVTSHHRLIRDHNGTINIIGNF